MPPLLGLLLLTWARAPGLESLIVRLVHKPPPGQGCSHNHGEDACKVPPSPRQTHLGLERVAYLRPMTFAFSTGTKATLPSTRRPFALGQVSDWEEGCWKQDRLGLSDWAINAVSRSLGFPEFTWDWDANAHWSEELIPQVPYPHPGPRARGYWACGSFELGWLGLSRAGAIDPMLCWWDREGKAVPVL